MEKILISACLVGDNTRYDGGNNLSPNIERLIAHYDLVPFCPEVEGGLPVPRVPAERKGNYVRTETGKDVTRSYLRGAEKAVQLCAFLGIKIAILKENSPACGVHQIHSGRFDGKKVPGQGVTAEALAKKGIRILSEEELPSFLEKLESQHAHAEARRQNKQEEALAPKPETSKPRFKDRKPSKFGKRKEGRPSPKAAKGGRPQKRGNGPARKPFKSK